MKLVFGYQLFLSLCMAICMLNAQNITSLDSIGVTKKNSYFCTPIFIWYNKKINSLLIRNKIHKNDEKL
jgi:hypothetical protein